MRKKVTVVGSGFVGSTTALRIAEAELADVAMVDIKDVVVFVDRQMDGLGVIEFATRLSEEHRAHLTGAFVWPTLPAEGPASFARGRAIQVS